MRLWRATTDRITAETCQQIVRKLVCESSTVCLMPAVCAKTCRQALHACTCANTQPDNVHLSANTWHEWSADAYRTRCRLRASCRSSWPRTRAQAPPRWLHAYIQSMSIAHLHTSCKNRDKCGCIWSQIRSRIYMYINVVCLLAQRCACIHKSLVRAWRVQVCVECT